MLHESAKCPDNKERRLETMRRERREERLESLLKSRLGTSRRVVLDVHCENHSVIPDVTVPGAGFVVLPTGCLCRRRKRFGFLKAKPKKGIPRACNASFRNARRMI